MIAIHKKNYQICQDLLHTFFQKYPYSHLQAHANREGNAWRAHQYETMFPSLIRSWRKSWDQGDFPFYYVQIAPYKYDPPLVAAELRYAQLKTLTEPNTGMVVTLDIGEANDIHPRNKRDVGHRLALWALAKNYKQNSITYSGPIYRTGKIENGRIRIFFDHVGSGLVFKGDMLQQFEIAGKDGKYVYADAKIDANTILVYNPLVKEPVAVRYWSNAPDAILFNMDGLPASPFKTDSCKGVLMAKLPISNIISEAVIQEHVSILSNNMGKS